MTRKEAIEAIKFGHCDDIYYRKEYEEAVDMAIKALEQEPCEDCISRQDAIACCRNEWEEEVLDRIEALPSVQPQPKTDTWSIKEVADTLEKHGLIREQEPCEDAVSRQALYEWLDGWKEKNKYYHPHTKNEIIPICEVIDIIQSLPPVTPKADDVIDKIRAEIMDFEEELFHRPNTDYSDYAAVRHCVEIIDKYKAEADDPDINYGNIESEGEE